MRNQRFVKTKLTDMRHLAKEYDKNSNTGLPCSECWAHEHSAHHSSGFLTGGFWHRMIIVGVVWPISLHSPLECKLCEGRAISVSLPSQCLAQCPIIFSPVLIMPFITYTLILQPTNGSLHEISKTLSKKILSYLSEVMAQEWSYLLFLIPIKCWWIIESPNVDNSVLNLLTLRSKRVIIGIIYHVGNN